MSTPHMEERFRKIARLAAGSASDDENANKSKDSAIDKALAYTSYYALVFTALCVFIPVETASAFSIVKQKAFAPLVHPMDMPVENQAERWELRSISDK